MKEYYIYKFLDKENNIIYIGKSVNLKQRITSHKTEHLKEGDWFKEVLNIEYFICNESEMNIYEPYLISIHKPKYNKEFKTKDLPSFNLDIPKFKKYKYTEDIEKNVELLSIDKLKENINFKDIKVFQKNKYIYKDSLSKNKDNSLDRIKKSIRNFFNNLTKKGSNCNVWTCYKEHINYLNSKGNIKNWKPIISNDTKNGINTIAFCANIYKNEKIGEANKINDDEYALLVLLNFINRYYEENKEIYLYIPSNRMLDLYNEFITKGGNLQCQS